MTDQQLVEKCIRKVRRAQRELFDRYYYYVYAVVKRYHKYHEDCEDIVMLVFNKVFQNLSGFQFRNSDSLKKWIKTITINESLRKFKNHNFIDFVGDIETLDYAEDEEDMDLLDFPIKEIYQEIERMPTGYRVVFLLHLVEGLTHSEIAEYLNISVNTSKSQMLKARRYLQSKFIKE